MKAVEPIKDAKIVKDIIDYLKLKNNRDAMFFMFGIYSGLRVSDIIKLRVRDVRGKDKIVIREIKTGKERVLKINPVLKKEIAIYIREKKDYEVLFKSQKGINKPISRQQAYHVINKAGRYFGIEHMGTHSMRKTFGYHIYQNTKDITLVQKMLNHSTPEYTLAYIGLTQEIINNTIDKLRY